MTQSNSTFLWTMMAVFLGNFAAILSSTTIIIPLPYLMTAFDTDLATISWAVTAFSLATGVIAPTTGTLTNRFGIRTTFLGALLCFILTSFACALSWNVYVLILFRFLQGLTCGIIIPVSMTVIYQVVSPRNQAFALSMWSMSGVLAPATGPSIAGIILQASSWHWVFLVNVPIVLLSLGLTLRFLPRQEKTAKSFPAFDSLGLILSMIGTTCLLMALSFSQDWGFASLKTMVLAGAGILLLAVFIRHEIRTPAPLIDFRVFRYRSFAYSGYANAFITLILNCSIYILPLYLQTVRHYTPFETGLLVLAGPIAVAVISPFAGKLYQRDQSKIMAIIGITGMGLGFVLLSQIHLITAIPYMISAIVVLEAGMGVAKIPGTNFGMEVLPRQLTAHGSAIISWIKQCSTSLAVGFITTLMLIRTRHHLGDLDLAAHPEAYRQAYEAGTIDIFHLAVIASIVFALSSFIWMKPAQNR